MSDKNNLIVVFTGAQAHAGLVKSVLEADGITAFLQDNIIGSIAPMYLGGGYLQSVKVAVRKRDLPRACELIDYFMGGE